MEIQVISGKYTASADQQAKQHDDVDHKTFGDRDQMGQRRLSLKADILWCEEEYKTHRQHEKKYQRNQGRQDHTEDTVHKVECLSCDTKDTKQCIISMEETFIDHLRTEQYAEYGGKCHHKYTVDLTFE